MHFVHEKMSSTGSDAEEREYRAQDEREQEVEADEDSYDSSSSSEVLDDGPGR